MSDETKKSSEHCGAHRQQTERNSGSWWRGGMFLAIAALLMMGQSSPDCGQIAGPEFEYMSTLRLEAAVPGTPRASNVKSDIVEEIGSAESKILAALGDDILNEEMTQALIQAKKPGNPAQGIPVRIVADSEDRGTDPFQTLEDAGFTSNLAGNCSPPNCDITYGDGQLEYLPNPNLTPVLSGCERNNPSLSVTCTANLSANLCGGASGDVGAMCRPNDFNRVSHRFFVIDTAVWNISGDGTGRGMLAYRAGGEWLKESFVREFRQMRGGTFSTTLDEYNGPLKAVTDPNVHYGTEKVMMELRYNPQERLMKHVVDKVYSARSSVTIVTPKLTNPFVVDALNYKASVQEEGNDFRVRIVISEQSQPDRAVNSELANLNTRTISGGRAMPTLVMIDGRRDPDFMNFNGNPKAWPRHAMILSHPLIRARPFEVLPPENPNDAGASDRVQVYPADLFNDGNMWHLYEFSTHAGEFEALDQFESFANFFWANGTEYQP